MAVNIEEITINGVTYIQETHDDGFVAKFIKDRGNISTPPEIQKAKNLINTVDLVALEGTDMGKCVKAILLCLKHIVQKLDVDV